MKISKKWLQDFVFLPDSLTAEDLAKELTLKTVEVEGIERQAQNLEHIVVGIVKSVEKHPNADKLKLAQVDVGDETLQIVCGGSNLEVGMKVAVAKIGARVVWHGQGEPIVMEKAAVRGVDSLGMICTSDEIGLLTMFPKKDEKELVNLNHLKVKPGTPLATALGLDDIILEVDNKSLSNRPDLWGHFGMARELATIYHKKLTEPNPPTVKAENKISLAVEVQNPELCSRYMAIAVEGVKVGPSPERIQKRLEACGVRPINNIVDITNYVMLELGQPTHAFDASKINGNKIIVRRAKEGEKFVTLDEKEHTLTSDMLMIADKERSLALAGIMGGMESGIYDTTTTIIFESATFDASTTRKTSTKLGLRTDASARFEKSLDPNNAELALRRLVELTLDVCPEAKVASKVVDVYSKQLQTKTIETSLDIFEKKIGIALDQKKITDILERLGFTVVATKKGNVKITVPSWRATKDINLAEDIVEEVIRILGYETVSSSMPTLSIAAPKKNPVKSLERTIKEYLALQAGCTESYNYSFESPEWLKRIGVDTSMHLELANPIAKDRPLIRRSLIPNLLENVENNLHRYNEVKIFETGRTYKIEEAGERVESGSAELLPRQDVHLGVVYSKKGETVPFYYLSHMVRSLFERLHVDFEFHTKEGDMENASWVHPGRFAHIIVDGDIVGSIAELHPHTATALGIDEKVALVEINLNILTEAMKEQVVYKPLSQYPEVTRDIAFVVESSALHADVSKILKNVDPLIRRVEIFDVFQGERLGENKKSMAYHVVYGSDEKTLTTAEVDAAHKKVFTVLEKQFKAEIRR